MAIIEKDSMYSVSSEVSVENVMARGERLAIKVHN